MSAKTVLVVHRVASVRDRFAAAIAEARHHHVLAATAAEATAAIRKQQPAVDLALVDLAIDDGLALVRALRGSGDPALPVVIFSGSLVDSALVPTLTGLGVRGYINDHAPAAQILPALAPHLFPDSFNRRSGPRIPLGVPVSYRAGQRLAGAVTLNVAKGGLAIRTMTPVPRGAPIQVKFQLPGIPTGIEASGRVTWSDRKVGMGVQFEQIAPTHQAVLDAFVDEHR